jgi:hypothetical protein
MLIAWAECSSPRLLPMCPLWSLSVEDLYTMAKALFGHVGGPDPRVVSEMRRLQQRVRDLEAELSRLQHENNALTAEAAVVTAQEREPALA